MTTIPEESVMAETLWAVNIHGPDDLIAAPDYMSAVRMANAFNAWWLDLKTKQPHNDAIDARMWAVPTDWEGNDARGHADELSKPHPEYQWLRDALSALEPSAARELALEEGDLQELLERLDAGLEYEGELETENDHIELFNVEAAQDLFADAAAAIRALSSPNHADAGKVEGDGWLPKAAALYDKCKLFPETSPEGFTALLQLRNHVAEILPSAPSQEVAGS